VLPVVTPGRYWTRRLLLVLAAVFLVSTAPAAEDPAVKAAELKQLRARIGTLKAGLLARREQKTHAEQQLQTIEQAVGQVRRALHTSEVALGRLVTRLETLRQQRRSVSGRLRHQSAALAREARAAYLMGRQQQVKLLLNQQQPAEVGRMLVYFSYFSQAQQASITAMHNTLQQLDTIQTGIQEKTRSLYSLQEKQHRQAARFRLRKQQRERLLARLNKQLNSQGDELKRLQQNKKQLQALVYSLQDLLTDIPANTSLQRPFRALKGRLRWPARGHLVRRFGHRRGASGLKLQGVLIEAPEGGQVRAVAQGRVAFADWLRGFGLLLIIDHGDGYMSLYGQNQALYKEVGEWVDSGEMVATLGASGGHTEAGLYFEIRHNGRPVNPLRWCTGRPGRVTG